MLLPAEIESKTLIPALRAIIAKNLATRHKIREDEISKMLGVTQAAISNYIRGTRGDPKMIEQIMQNEQVSKMVGDLCEGLASDRAYTPASLARFIGLCNYIKSSLIICDKWTTDELGKHGTVVLHGRGETITSAVTIANIVTERLLKGNSKVDSILLSSDVPKTMGRMISTIQITLKKS